MQKQGTFIKKQFNRLLFGNIFGALAYAINMMIDSIIGGSQLGELALEAVSIVYPMFSIAELFSSLLPLGISVLFGKSIGEFKQEDAYRVAGTGITASCLISIFLALGIWLIKYPFLNYYGCTGELLEQASAYYNWLVCNALLMPLVEMVYCLAITDGETLLFSIAEIGGILENILLSVVLSRRFGIAGLGMATTIYLVIEILCFSLHFLKKSNNVKFRICLDFKVVKKAIILSFSEYMYFFFLALVDIILNKIIIAYCGMEYIPAYSVVNLVFSVCEVFIAINNSSIGLVTCFFGERNNLGLSLVFRRIFYAIAFIAVALTLIFFFGAPLMPVIYGLETPITINAAILTSRIMSFTALGFGCCYVGGVVSSSVEKPGQACFISFLNDVFSPLLLSLALGAIWGFTGIVIGMSLSSYFAVGLYTLLSILRKGKKGFPFYVEDFGSIASSYDLYVDPKTLVELRDVVKSNLTEHGFDVKNVDLLMEEFFTRVMEKNPGKKVLAECTLLYENNVVRIIIRDNGVLFNFVDENNRVESLNAYVLNSILEQTKEKNYVLTTAFNRNGFIFEK